MVDLRSDKGTSLIWFISLLVLITLVCLLLVSSVHEYLFARNLHDFVEQYALAAKTLFDGGMSVSGSNSLLGEKVLSLENISGLRVVRSELLDSRSLQVVVCATWHAPLPIFEYTKQICESAIAR